MWGIIKHKPTDVGSIGLEREASKKDLPSTEIQTIDLQIHNLMH